MRKQEFTILAGIDNQWTFIAKAMDGKAYLGCFNDAQGSYYYGNPLQSATQFRLPEGSELQIASLDYGYWDAEMKINVDLNDFIEDADGNKYFAIIEMGFVGTRPPVRRP